MEDKDEESLQGVEDGEDVGAEQGFLTDVEQAKGPGEPQ